MEQGARGRHIDPVGQTQQGAEGGRGLLQVVHPDVAAVDHARDQALAGEAAHGGEGVQVGGGRLGEIESETVDRSLGQHRQRVAEPVEVRGDQDLRPVREGAERSAGARRGVQLGRGAVLDEGCRVCERLDCPQRAAPPLGSPLWIDEDTSTFVPYPVAE